MTTRAGRWRNGLAGLAAVAVLVVAGAAPASAHTHVEGSEPADGAVLERAPDRVVVEFSEDLEPGRSSATLTSDGTTIELVAVVDPGDERRLVVALPDGIADGVHRVAYRAHGAADLHEVAGSIVFGVGVAPTVTGGPNEPPTRAVEVLARAAAGLGFAVAAAGVLVLFVLPRRRPAVRELRPAERSVRAVTCGGLAAVVLGTVVALVDHALAIGGPVTETVWRVLTSTGPGRRAVLTLEAVAILGVLVAASRPGARRGRALRLPLALRSSPTPGELGSAGAVLGLAAALGAGGHDGSGAPALVDSAVFVLHVLTSGAWVGSLVLLPVVVRAMGIGWRGSIRALAPVAEVLVLITVVTGLILAAGRVRTVTALLAPGYGWIVVAKVVAVAVAVALGVTMFRTSTRTSGDPGRVRRGELAVACALVVLAAWLTATSTATGPEFEPPLAEPATAWNGQADDLAVRLTLSPNRPGTNLVGIEVHDTRRPAPRPIDTVTVAGLGSDGAIEAQPAGDGRWDLGTIDLRPGGHDLTITAKRLGLPDARASIAWSVPSTPVARHDTIVSTARLRPALDLVALAGAGVGALLLRHRHRHRHPHPHLEASDDHHRDLPGAPATVASPNGAGDADDRGDRPGSHAGGALLGR